MLERLVHWGGQLPPNQHFVEITIPAGTSYEVFPAEHHPEWFRPDGEAARRYSRGWYDQGRSAVLVVRSEEHTSELQSLMRISYAVFCLTKKKKCTLNTSNTI